MFRALLLFCLLIVPAYTFGDEPRKPAPPVVIDISLLDDTTVPTHIAKQPITFSSGKKLILNSVTKVVVGDKQETDDTVTLNVDLTGVQCNRRVSGPAVITYKLVTKGTGSTWKVDNIDGTKMTFGK